MFNTYLLDNHKDEIITILEDEDVDKHYSIIIKYVSNFNMKTSIYVSVTLQFQQTFRKLRRNMQRPLRKTGKNSQKVPQTNTESATNLAWR